MTNMILGGLQGGVGGAAMGASLAASPFFGPLAIPIVAGLGAISGILGGGSSSSGGGGFRKKDIKKALIANNEWERKQLKEQWGIGIRAQELALKLYDDERERGFDLAMKEYQVYLDNRETNYNVAYDLFEDSVDAFDQAVELNNISAQIAINDAGRVRNDRIFELGIAQQQIFIQDEVFAAQSELSDSLIKSEMSSSIELANLNAQSIGNQISTELATGAAELQAQEFSIAADMINLRAQGEAALAQGELKMDDILLSLDKQIAEADTAQQLLRLSLDETRANAAIQTDQARREGLLAEGAQIAKGQAGRSAAKSVQGIAFQSSQAQALIANAIVRADAKYLIDKNAIVEQLEFAREQGKNQLRAAAIESDVSAAQMAAAGLNMQAQSAQLDARAAQMAGAVTSAGLQLDQLSVDLISSQTRLQGELASNAIARAEAAAASALSLSSIDYAKQSAMDQYKRDVEGIGFQHYQANLAAASQVLDEPMLPPLAEPPQMPPPLVLDPMPDIDWKGVQKLMDKNRKAGMATNLASLVPEVNTIANNLQLIGNSAVQLAEAFKPAPNPVQQSQPFKFDNYFDPKFQIETSYTPPIEFSNPVVDFSQPLPFDIDYGLDLGSNSFAIDNVNLPNVTY